MVKINHSIKKSQLFVRNITLHYISLTSVAIHPELWYIHIRSEMTLARQLPQPHVVEAPGSPQKIIYHHSSYFQICTSPEYPSNVRLMISSTIFQSPPALPHPIL